MTLIQFFDLNEEETINKIIAFRFFNGKLYHSIYDLNVYQIGNQFTFWINEQTTLGEKDNLRNKYCLSNMIIHRYSPYNLTSIKLNVKLRKITEG